jgi:glyoxylase-like metal-dependent hydrolase (beta-lactamase superfamily II)
VQNTESMRSASSAVCLLDLAYLGHPRYVAAGLLQGPEGTALVDPGATSSLAGLRTALAEHGLSVTDVRAILITHIHLDHSGVTGTLLRENPEIAVYVHDRGAPHVVNPARLLRSAQRLYGADMDRLWGEVAPVPAGQVKGVHGGERLTVIGREVRVAYTPGHAWHHVTYFDPASGTAFTGDIGGMRLSPEPYVFPPTPPPDIDVVAWAESIGVIEALRPDRLLLTHFGVFDDVSEHLRTLRARLHLYGEIVGATLEHENDDAHRMSAFAREVGIDLRRHLPEEAAARYERGVPLGDCWRGLARYWRTRGAERRQPGVRDGGPVPNRPAGCSLDG